MRSCQDIQHIKKAGFTLVELLVVMVVLAILATVGIPNFGPTVANSRVTSAANDLLGALQLARSEAVRLNEPVLITPTGGNWADGWAITRAGTTIRQRDALARVTIAGGPANVEFGSAGNANTTASFTIEANGGGNPRRCLTVAASGSAVVTPGGC